MFQADLGISFYRSDAVSLTDSDRASCGVELRFSDSQSGADKRQGGANPVQFDAAAPAGLFPTARHLLWPRRRPWATGWPVSSPSSGRMSMPDGCRRSTGLTCTCWGTVNGPRRVKYRFDKAPESNYYLP